MPKHITTNKSKIHGNGIFAARNFTKGEVVIKWSSHKQIVEKDIAMLTKKEQKFISYINGCFMTVPPEARLNHSCSPNVYLDDFKYIARKKINKGDEITCDYRKESQENFKMKCCCGSKNCKGFITLFAR